MTAHQDRRGDRADLPTPDEIIKAIARSTAEANIPIGVATKLFDGIYLANALHRANGSVSRAAEIAGMERGHLYRILNNRSGKKRKDVPDGG